MKRQEVVPIQQSIHNFYAKPFVLGEIFEDFGCLSINMPCGKNMVFRPIMKIRKINNSPWQKICVQRCSCASEKYEEIDGRCTEWIVFPNVSHFDLPKVNIRLLLIKFNF